MISEAPAITIVYNTAFYVYKFRVNLIKRLQEQGFRVIVISPKDEYVTKLLSLGVEHFEISMSQYGMNPVKEIATIWQIYQLLKRLDPVCSLHYTIKPNIFGSLAARVAGVPVINNIAGAGRAFSDESSILAAVVSKLYRYGLRASRRVFFQNNEDMNLFVERGLVKLSIASRIPGSGVDLEQFSVSKAAKKSACFKFLFVGRLLREKGILEFLSAARSLSVEIKDKNVCFECVGELDNAKGCIRPEELEEFLRIGSISYRGTVSPDLMPTVLDECDCVVLPSYYREGVPRSLLEAAAKGKPIITTDNIGCRDVVDDDVTGFIVPVRDAEAVKKAMAIVLSLTPQKLDELGRQARLKIESEFNEKFVLDAYMFAIRNECNIKRP